MSFIHCMYGPLGTGGTFVKYLGKRPLSFALTFALAHFSTRYYESYFIELAKRVTTDDKRSYPAWRRLLVGSQIVATPARLPQRSSASGWDKQFSSHVADAGWIVAARDAQPLQGTPAEAASRTSAEEAIIATWCRAVCTWRQKT